MEKTMRMTSEKAKVIYRMNDENLTWQESLQAAAIANRINKTRAVIDAVKMNGGFLPIEVAMSITGLDKNNLQSRFRKARILANDDVYYAKEIDCFVRCYQS